MFQSVVVLISEISQIIFFNEIYQFSRNFGGKSWIWTGSRRSWEIIHEQFVRTSVKMNPSKFQLNRVINRKSVLIFLNLPDPEYLTGADFRSEGGGKKFPEKVPRKNQLFLWD